MYTLKMSFVKFQHARVGVAVLKGTVIRSSDKDNAPRSFRIQKSAMSTAIYEYTFSELTDDSSYADVVFAKAHPKLSLQRHGGGGNDCLGSIPRRAKTFSVWCAPSRDDKPNRHGSRTRTIIHV